jgi:5-(carboxyamino)imidazole ribonucleotide synthase
MSSLKRVTLGIVGGGQLGRMTAMAAARLGIECHIYCPDEDAPAAQVAARTFRGAYDDKRMLAIFADSVDSITYEFENIPVETLQFLLKYKPVFPDVRVLETAQDRIKEKQFLNDIGIPTASWAPVACAADIAAACDALPGDSFIIKTARMGYDGKGQASFERFGDTAAIWERLNTASAIVEQKIDFECELSVIVARDKIGQSAVYGPMLNEHANHILSKTIAPAPVAKEIMDEARAIAVRLAEATDLVGVLALEMFLTKDGRLLANEMAPRPHNSGHWTIDACAVSQFEQHVRTTCGMPVGSPARHSNAEMHNLLGGAAADLEPWIEREGACIHLYGKYEIREGRKLGHVTLLTPHTTS